MPPAPTPPPRDRDLRSAFAREGRLYGLGLVCAVPGALAVWRTDSFWIGALVFLAVLGVAGSGLWALERRLAARRAGRDGAGSSPGPDRRGPRTPENPRPPTNPRPQKSPGQPRDPRDRRR
ncbi:hypothetical protein GC722_12845 [Auraticoccus sp. F435]|uniref:Uncharacterized protein n=1 Tax=Auraticoccus cholistanensis TaxID=2656650 RepID=A0A6A9UYL0_9ACTN|nr:hypothetical protein [Auraticoccus cholistanensis]MVA76904.1 hypothetical protein [Auraticoccus cholistanensis]